MSASITSVGSPYHSQLDISNIEVEVWSKCVKNLIILGPDRLDEKADYADFISIFLRKIKESARTGRTSCILHSYGASLPINTPEGAYCERAQDVLCKKIQDQFTVSVGEGLEVTLHYWQGTSTNTASLDSALTFKAHWNKSGPFKEIYMNAVTLNPEYTSMTELKMWKTLSSRVEAPIDSLFDSGAFHLNRSDEVQEVSHFFNLAVEKLRERMEGVLDANLQGGLWPVSSEVFTSQHSQGRFFCRNFKKIKKLLVTHLPQELTASFALSMHSEKTKDFNGFQIRFSRS